MKKIDYTLCGMCGHLKSDGNPSPENWSCGLGYYEEYQRMKDRKWCKGKALYEMVISN